MAEPGFSQYIMVSPVWAGHTLDLIRVTVDQVTANAVPWWDCHALRAYVNVLPQTCLGGEHILAHLQNQMDPCSFRWLCRILCLLVAC